MDMNKYKKDRTVCKTCYNKNKRKNNNNTLPPNFENVNNNKVNKKINVSKFGNRVNVNIGPRNVGKTYYMRLVLEKRGKKRPIHIITRSPNQYPIYKTNNEIETINKYKGSVFIFDEMLGANKSSQIEDFFTRGRHEDLDVYYISQS